MLLEALTLEPDWLEVLLLPAQLCAKLFVVLADPLVLSARSLSRRVLARLVVRAPSSVVGGVLSSLALDCEVEGLVLPGKLASALDSSVGVEVLKLLTCSVLESEGEPSVLWEVPVTADSERLARALCATPAPAT